MAGLSVDFRPLGEIFAVSWWVVVVRFCPLRLGLLWGDESSDSVAGIGTAETSEMIRAKSSATRPARERIFEKNCMMICVGPADWKEKRARSSGSYSVWLLRGCTLSGLSMFHVTAKFIWSHANINSTGGVLSCSLSFPLDAMMTVIDPFAAPLE